MRFLSAKQPRVAFWRADGPDPTGPGPTGPGTPQEITVVFPATSDGADPSRLQVHRLITEGTVEDRIAAMLERKRELADAVLMAARATQR